MYSDIKLVHCVDSRCILPNYHFSMQRVVFILVKKLSCLIGMGKDGQLLITHLKFKAS